MPPLLPLLFIGSTTSGANDFRFAQTDQVEFRLIPRLDTLTPTGESPSVSGRLEATIVGGDGATVAQPFTCHFIKGRSGWEVRGLAVDSSVVALPWDIGATRSWSTEHLVLFTTPDIADPIEALLPHLEQTAARAFLDVPDHGITGRVVSVITDKLPDRNGLGGFSATPEAFGYVVPVEAAGGALVHRMLLTRAAGDENIAQMLRHELIHVLAASWAPRSGLGTPLVMEGLAYWAETGFAGELIPFIRKFQIVTPEVLADAVANQLTFTVSATKHDTKRALGEVYLQAAFHAWVETLTGRDGTWALARECYVENDHKKTYARGLGLATFSEVTTEFGNWARTTLL